jgi:hypothetical protein
VRRGRWLALLLALPGWAAQGALPGWEGGHAKLQWLGSYWPDDSLFREVLDATTHDQGGELRLRFAGAADRWALRVDYQLFARRGDTLALARDFGDLYLVPPAVPDDARRWWDLTRTLDEGDSHSLVHRLDRLHLDYTGERTVLRFGRQAVSWGNGLLYNPMDFFNPFDPAAVDTEYKTGDDMLYAQYLLDNGSDWQFVSVQRRDADGEVTREVSSNALKFHHFGGERELDLLLAEHYDQLILGIGGSTNWGGAVLRGDVTLTDGSSDWVASAVANWSWSFTWSERNVSVAAEYFFNGFGLRESDYSVARIAAERDLAERLARGELYTVGRHYLAGSLTAELTPLLQVTPTLFYNLGDSSALAQLALQWDLQQDLQLLAAVNLPLGAAGTEYGGLETDIPGVRLSSGPALFAQLAWYF